MENIIYGTYPIDSVQNSINFTGDHMAFKWKKEDNEIARIIPKKEVPGFFRKEIILSPNEKAIIVKNGEVQEIIEDGKLRVGGLLKAGNIGKDVDVVLMDTSPKDLKWQHTELWTSDSQEVSCGGLFRIKIFEPKSFFQMLYAYSTSNQNGERGLSLADIYMHIDDEVITLVLEPAVHNETIDNLYGNLNLRMKLENELEMRLKSTLSRWGLEVLTYTVKWNLGSHETVMQATNNFQTREELEELNTLAVEGDFERTGRGEVAAMRAGQATIATANEFHRNQREEDVQSVLELERLQHEADMQEARDAIRLKEELKLSKAKGMKAELEVEQDMKDREHGRDMEYLTHITEKGGSDVAKTISEGREYGKMSAAQLEALAKVKQSESMAKEDKIQFMMEVEDRERSDSYRRQELDAAMMGAAQGRKSPTVQKCPGCGSTIPSEASFCSQCGTKIRN